MKNIVITGAAGNLGSILAKTLVEKDVNLRLMFHRKPISNQLLCKDNVRSYKADLNDKSSLEPILSGADVVVHFAGVLFSARPEKFLPKTNIGYFANLLDVAKNSGVKRIILISFPHVEGETTPDNMARGCLDRVPASVHAATRLEEEKMLLDLKSSGIECVVLRVGMVYGGGILMIDAARRFSRYCLLGVWHQPTWIHLISTEDFVQATIAAILKDGVSGIYHLGDDGVQTLQTFLRDATNYWGTCAPIRMPLWMIYGAASLFEFVSMCTGCRSLLTCDFITIGRASYYGDTSRMRAELLPQLKYRTYRDGIESL